MFRTKLTSFSNKGGEPLITVSHNIYPDREAAKLAICETAINDLSNLCGIMEDETFPELRFVPTMNQDGHYLVINAWDGPDYRPVMYFDIIHA